MTSISFPQYYDYTDPVTSCFTFHPQKGLTFVHNTRIVPFFSLSNIPVVNVKACCYDNTYTSFYALYHEQGKVSVYIDSGQDVIQVPLSFISPTWEDIGMFQYNGSLYIIACYASQSTIYVLACDSALTLIDTYNYPYKIYRPTYSPPHSFIAFISYVSGKSQTLYALAEFSLPTVSLIRHLPSSFPFEITLPSCMTYFPPRNCFLMQMGDRLFSANLLLYELSMITPEGEMFIGDFIDLGTIMSNSYYKVHCYIKNISSHVLQDVKISLPLEKPYTWEATLWDNVTLSTDVDHYGQKQIELGNIPPGGSKQWFLTVVTPDRFQYNAKGTYISPLYVSTKRSDI